MTDHVETLNQVPALAADVLRDDISIEPTMRGELADSVAREIVEELAAVAARSPNRAAFAQAASKEALGQLGVRHSVKGRALYHPIRIAVTGQERGIELPVLLPLLGPERVVKRIRTALS
jgi:glutamyl/glutaminyl-tRNA synthetase